MFPDQFFAGAFFANAFFPPDTTTGGGIVFDYVLRAPSRGDGGRHRLVN